MRLLQELRQTLRAIAHQPGLALLSIVALGLGIGLPTAMFSFVDGAVMRGLPVERPSQIFHLERRRVRISGEGNRVHARDYVAWQEQQRSFEQLAAFNTQSVTLRSDQGADRWNGASITPNTFELLRTRAALGRVFNAQDAQPGAAPVVLLGHTIWRDRFAGDRAVIGRIVHVEGKPHTVVGVMPPKFRFPGAEELWLPLVIGAAQAADPAAPTMDVFGRLRPGVSRDQAHAEFAVIAAQMAERYPATNRNLEITVKRFTERFIGETATATMYVMLGAVLLVLLVACINVANLLLVRAVDRMREIAIRSALGASRGRIIKHLFLESLVLAVAGGGLGVVVAILANRAMTTMFVSQRLPYWAEVRLDTRVLGFALLLTALAAIGAAVFPAWKVTRVNLSATLYDSSRGSTGLRVGRLMRGLIVLEVAFSFALLAATGLMARGVMEVKDVPLGFTTNDVYTARVSLPESYDAAARTRYYDELQRSLRAAPAVTSATLATSVPAARGQWRRLSIDGETYANDEDRPATRTASISQDFFSTFNVQMVRGRAFGPQDLAAARPVAIVNARFERNNFPNGDALGRRIRLVGTDEPWRTIVGVMPDLWIGGLDSTPERNPDGVYLPLAQTAPQSVALAVRVRGSNPMELSSAVRSAAFALDPDVPLYDVKSMPEVVKDNSWFYGMGAGIMAACGLSALLLAAIGLYGVIAYSITRRTREFGIRMAVGASPRNVIRLVLRQSTSLVSGLVFGLILALVLARGVSSLLFGVSPSDPLVLIAVTLLMTSIGLTATLVPAISASRINPLALLREK